jgi:2-dehydropantoate 2-reductase
MPGELTERGSKFSASILRDLKAGSRTKGEQILGDMPRRACALATPAPMLQTAFCHLQVHEHCLAARR